MESYNSKKLRVSYNDLNSVFSIFIFIDLLFLPRLLFVFGIPVSLLFVILSIIFINSSRSVSFNYLSLFLFISLLTIMSTSTSFGIITDVNPEPLESFKRVLQLATLLLYSFYRLDIKEIKSGLIIVLRIFYVWIFSLMLLSYFNSTFYYSFMSKIYPEAVEYLEWNLATFRFSYFYTDPNSAAYLICLTLAVYAFWENKLSWGLICGFLASLTIIGTQSRGAYIVLLIIFMFILFRKKTSVSNKMLITFVITLLASAVYLYFGDEVQQAYKIYEMRLAGEEDLGGGRTGKYFYFLQNLNILPFGTGYSLLRDGLEFRPHSDLIRLNLSYGAFALPLLLYYVFPRRRSQLLLFLVFLVPFLINTVIDDYRLLPMYLLLSGLLGQANNSDFVALKN